MNIKKSLKVALANAETTQAKLAGDLGINASQFSRTLSKEHYIRIGLIKNIANRFEMSTSEFIALGE